MAESVDNFSDLQELGIDISDTDTLTLSFNKAARQVQKLVTTLDNQILLTLYGYYKQGTEGTCKVPRPSWYDLRAKSKWEAWNKLGNLSQEDAKKKYIETVKTVDPTFDEDIQEAPSQQWIKVSSMIVDNDIPQSDLTIIDHIRKNDIKQVKTYLETNNPDFVSEGLYLIHWAADAGSIDMLKTIIDAGADINIKDSDGQTALHYAASCGHIECVKFLLQSGANKEAKDHDDSTPSDVAFNIAIKELLS
ncbi:acyl-CoA-binding domain-containing protein 6-like [Diorhabda sublineata]|uniref:acyl-CoA-binding domain-containing protein 6-like n=1 Tax=Diorhabda sublineata TaxID=1163346 RepID=UPI0024E19608|nr:acyl-CoA-binding domain-containing protein 6-like [Diorhabda sublineata]